jgi:predicted enzyme related to lactoylglutathione lyase
MPRPIHFEITATDPERVTRFYSDVFGWQFQRWEGPMEYWMIITGDEKSPGINGGLGRRQDGASATTNTIDVPSLDAALASVEKSGGTVTVPKMAIPGIGWLAYCVDPEGTSFGMMEGDPAAR